MYFYSSMGNKKERKKKIKLKKGKPIKGMCQT